MEEIRDFICQTQDAVLSGKEITRKDALRLMQVQESDLMFLFAAANHIRQQKCGNKVHLCGIVNAKSGACTEDCVFCSQSAKHKTGVAAYKLLDPLSILEAAKTSVREGASCFGIVTAWKGIEQGPALESICKAISLIAEKTSIIPHLSLGLIQDPQVASRLYHAGAREYNINLESGPEFYPKICTTHSYEERLLTARLVKEAGMQLCSGGLFGLGETLQDRVELAFALRQIDVDTVPLNFYHHQPGNKVDTQAVPVLSALEALKVAAVFRFILPEVVLKIAGGRETTLGELQSMMFFSGVNSCMVGNYLTTAGRHPDMDRELVRLSGLEF